MLDFGAYARTTGLVNARFGLAVQQPVETCRDQPSGRASPIASSVISPSRAMGGRARWRPRQDHGRSPRPSGPPSQELLPLGGRCGDNLHPGRRGQDHLRADQRGALEPLPGQRAEVAGRIEDAVTHLEEFFGLKRSARDIASDRITVSIAAGNSANATINPGTRGSEADVAAREPARSSLAPTSGSWRRTTSAERKRHERRVASGDQADSGGRWSNFGGGASSAARRPRKAGRASPRMGGVGRQGVGMRGSELKRASGIRWRRRRPSLAAPGRGRRVRSTQRLKTQLVSLRVGARSFGDTTDSLSATSFRN